MSENTSEKLVQQFLNVDLAKKLLKRRTDEELLDRLGWEESKTFRSLIEDELYSRGNNIVN